MSREYCLGDCSWLPQNQWWNLPPQHSLIISWNTLFSHVGHNQAYILWTWLAAPSFALPLSYLFNLSIQDSIVTSQWKTSSITPVPNVVKPESCQEYQPISVTPILSSLIEKEIVT